MKRHILTLVREWNNYKESEPIKCAFTFRE